MIQSMLGLGDLVVGDSGKVVLLGGVLADESIGVLVKAPLPGGVGMGKMHEEQMDILRCLASR